MDFIQQFYCNFYREKNLSSGVEKSIRSVHGIFNQFYGVITVDNLYECLVFFLSFLFKWFVAVYWYYNSVDCFKVSLVFYLFSFILMWLLMLKNMCPVAVDAWSIHFGAARVNYCHAYNKRDSYFTSARIFLFQSDPRYKKLCISRA